MANSDPLEDEIRILIKTINDAWLSIKPEAVRLALASCFHEEMVIKGCEMETLAAGRDACVNSYLDFIQQAHVSDFQSEDADIHVFGDAGIPSYGWRIVYSMDGKDCDERGSDIFVFVRRQGKWLAVWRAMLT